MGYHIKYEELTRVRESMLRELDGWLEQLETVKSSLRMAADMPEMKGAAGDSVRSYLKEVHLSLVEMISDTIRVYRDNLVRYTGWYYSIETDMMAEFSQEAIENQMELLNSGRFAYDETMEELNGILSEVGNYMSIEPVSRLPVTSKYATTYIHLDNLNNMIGQYEESHKNGDLTLTREMIENITAVIRRQQGLSGDTISTYQPGSISDLPAFQKASLQNGLQKNYITLTRGLVEDSEAIYTERQEAWEEAVRQRKEQEFVNMMAALGTLIIGGVVIICTFGAATPLVAGTTAVTVSSVVSLSAGLTIGSGAFLYGCSNWQEAYDSYQYGLAGDARTVAVNPIRDTIFASDPGLYYTVGNACTMTAAMMLPVGGSMTAAVHAGTSPVRAGLTELGMLGYSSVMATEAEDIVTDLTDSELAGMVAGTIVGIGSYGGLKSLDQSVNISGLYPLKETPNSYAELMAPEEAERYLKFLEKGSTEGLTDAELEAIRKVDEALALKKADGQSVMGLRGPAAIEGGTYSGDLMSAEEAARYSEHWRELGIGSDNTWKAFKDVNPNGTIDDYFEIAQKQSPWPLGETGTPTTLKAGDRFFMAVENNAPENVIGGFGVKERIESTDFVRNNLSVKYDWKTSCNVIREFEVNSGIELNVNAGPVGPQIDLGADLYLPGDTTITQYDLFSNLGSGIKREDYVHIVDEYWVD